MKVLDEASVASFRQRAEARGPDIFKFIFSVRRYGVIFSLLCSRRNGVGLETTMPKKRAKKSRSPLPKKVTSKAAFVRSFPTVTPAKEVVAKARSQGIHLTDAYVYNVRATSRAGRKSPGGSATKNKTKRRTIKVGRRRGAEDLLRAVAAEMGLTRAIAVLQAEHNRVRS
jgi:hypothetical protein